MRKKILNSFFNSKIILPPDGSCYKTLTHKIDDPKDLKGEKGDTITTNTLFYFNKET